MAPLSVWHETMLRKKARPNARNQPTAAVTLEGHAHLALALALPATRPEPGLGFVRGKIVPVTGKHEQEGRPDQASLRREVEASRSET